MSEPRPTTRAQRLLSRAKEAHEMVSRLAEDLNAHEGAGSALGAQASLSELCLLLERRANEIPF